MKVFLKMIGAKGTREILEFLDENRKGRYMQFRQFASTHMLNIRLRELLIFGLIEHHITKSERMNGTPLPGKGRKFCAISRKWKKSSRNIDE